MNILQIVVFTLFVGADVVASGLEADGNIVNAVFLFIVFGIGFLSLLCILFQDKDGNWPSGPTAHTGESCGNACPETEARIKNNVWANDTSVDATLQNVEIATGGVQNAAKA